MFRRELKLIKKRREGDVSRIKLKFRLTNVQGVDNSKGQSAADKIIVVSYVSWSISLNGWMQPNEARRRITSTPYLSSFRLNIAGRSVFRLENRPFSATFDINYISFTFTHISSILVLLYILFVQYNIDYNLHVQFSISSFEKILSNFLFKFQHSRCRCAKRQERKEDSNEQIINR